MVKDFILLGVIVVIGLGIEPAWVWGVRRLEEHASRTVDRWRD